MSLTRHLKSADSPVRAFFEERLSSTPGIASSVQPVGPALVLPSDAVGYPWSLVGTAFDYRLRYGLAITDPPNLAAAQGAQSLWGGNTTGYQELRDALDGLFAAQSPVGRVLAREDEEKLARLCLVLALYEQVYRAGPSPHWPIVQAGRHASLDDLLGLVDDRCPADLAALTNLLYEAQLGLLRPTAFTLNPTFAASGALGGADADLIADGLLLDIKTMKEAKVNRELVWQLLGYALADTDDRHRIEQVGVYFSRQGELRTWPVADLVTLLAGHPVPLAELRADFRRLLDQYRREAVQQAG